MIVMVCISLQSSNYTGSNGQKRLQYYVKIIRKVHVTKMGSGAIKGDRWEENAGKIHPSPTNHTPNQEGKGVW